MNKYFEGQSIQVTLSGFSFFRENCRIECAELSSELSEIELQQINVVEFSTPKVLIIPFEIFDHALLNTYLKTTKLIDENTERALFAVSGDFVAVWAASLDNIEYLEEQLPEALNTHPLLKLLENVAYQNQSVVAIEVYDISLLHIVVSSQNGVEFAQTITINSLEDILYYILKLTEGNDVKQIIISEFTHNYVTDFLSLYFRGLLKIDPTKI